MAKKQRPNILLTSERPMTRGVRRTGPGVIRVRLYQGRGGEPRYYLDSVPFVHVPVPPVLRHLDGVTVRGLLLAVVLVAGVGYGLARWLLLARSGSDGA